MDLPKDDSMVFGLGLQFRTKMIHPRIIYCHDNPGDRSH